MSTPLANQPAFPTYPTHKPGVTKREYFAAMAMQGIISNPTAMEPLGRVAEKEGLSSAVVFAHTALQFADALIAALESPKTADGEVQREYRKRSDEA